MVAIEYLSTFCKHVESDGLQGMDRVHSQMIDAMKKYGLKHVPLDTIKGLLALVTNLLLSRLAKLVAVFESCDLSLGMAAVANAINMQNYTGYSGKTQLALYAKRISCQCFDGLVAHIMTCSMKIESVYCEYCCIEFPSTVLFKCSQCRSVQYCSKICQRKHWPQHENYCAFVDQMKKTSQQTTTTP